MSEKDKKTAMVVATVSVYLGVLFCFVAAWCGFTAFGSGFLTGEMGVAMGVSYFLPSLAGGLLLIVAGVILRAVTDDSSAGE